MSKLSPHAIEVMQETLHHEAQSVYRHQRRELDRSHARNSCEQREDVEARHERERVFLEQLGARYGLTPADFPWAHERSTDE